MVKLYRFVRRHPALTPDQYRAAHVGYHSSVARRLNGLRAYLVNVRAGRDLGGVLEDLVLGCQAPAAFNDNWDGYEQWMFTSFDDYLTASTAVVDKPGPAGLERDDPAAALADHAGSVFAESPPSFAVAESVLVPVRRPEHKLFKLVQFARRRADLTPAAFHTGWCGAYAALSHDVPGLLGHIVNFPVECELPSAGERLPPDTAMLFTGTDKAFFPSQFDGFAELWFRDAEAFFQWRRRADQALRHQEADLFGEFFFCEVDETVAVLPDRLSPAHFYRR